MNARSILLPPFFCLCLALPPGAQPESVGPKPKETPPVIFQSSDRQVALLELFTSEGCSSCPPAEKWLSGLKDSARLWTEFVPVAFHVDYWDYLGWRDPWGAKDFSGRQRAYAQLWHSDSIYTPGFVLGGKEWRDGSRPKDGPRSSGAKAGVLKAGSADLRHWHATFAPASHAQGGYELHAALLANNLTSDVKAGENRGLRLHHDFVVTALTRCSLPPNGDSVEGEFTFDLPKGQTARLALAVWVTLTGHLEPLQATGGWLP